MSKKIEELSKKQELLIKESLENRLQNINALIASKTETISNAPKGSLRISKSHGKTQYYHKSQSSKKTGTYIPKSQEALALCLAQKEYDQSLLQELNKEQSYISKVLNKLKSFSTAQIYKNLSDDRKKLVTPVSYEDSEYINLWNSIIYTQKTTASDGNFKTLKGDLVKTQTEKLIADSLFNAGIPYKYEYALTLESGAENLNAKRSGGLLSVINSYYTFYCTFYCLNIRTREEFAWEVFDNMDIPEKVEAAIKKLSDFNNSGFYSGKNLITTMETTSTPVTEKAIEKYIQVYLK